jgi:hypothetical protein
VLFLRGKQARARETEVLTRYLQSRDRLVAIAEVVGTVGSHSEFKFRDVVSLVSAY